MQSRISALLFLLVIGLAMPAAADVASDLLDAVNNHQIAFILVTDRGATGVDAAREKVQSAMQHVDGSVLVELDRGDPANAELVAQYRLAGAPVPVILIAARNGVLAAGFPAGRVTATQLVTLVPSPKKEEILQALQDGHAVFVIASREGMATKPVTSACAAACNSVPSNGVTVEIDLDDPAETGFLQQLKISRSATAPVTLVINAQGQFAGTYTGVPDIASLAMAATRKVSSCCAPTPDNPNPTCGTAKK